MDPSFKGGCLMEHRVSKRTKPLSSVQRNRRTKGRRRTRAKKAKMEARNAKSEIIHAGTW